MIHFSTIFFQYAVEWALIKRLSKNRFFVVKSITLLEIDAENVGIRANELKELQRRCFSDKVEEVVWSKREYFSLSKALLDQLDRFIYKIMLTCQEIRWMEKSYQLVKELKMESEFLSAFPT